MVLFHDPTKDPTHRIQITHLKESPGVPNVMVFDIEVPRERGGKGLAIILREIAEQLEQQP